MSVNIADLRREYTFAGLRRAELDADPMAQFHKWFNQAIAAELIEPNAMTLATTDKQGMPAARIVLLKAVDHRGFIFFTNYESAKGQELAANPQAALLFFWHDLERQIRINGSITKVSREESAKYFNGRPRGSRLGAWASIQSTVVASRAELEARIEKMDEQYPGEEVPLPPYWGGYSVAPITMEFWQGRPNRLHDRFRYQAQPGGQWLIERLSP